MIRTEKAEGLRPRPINTPGGRRRPERAGGPAAGPGATTLEGSRGKRRTAPELGIQGATRESYGMAVTVRASSSLFSLRRCVSKRSPTLKDVTFWMVRPVRL